MASLLRSRYPAGFSKYGASITSQRISKIATQPRSLPRSYATSGDLGNPQSSSKEESNVKSSRAAEGGSPDSASLQTPVSNESKIPGEQDEGTPSHEQAKRDPSEPAEKKRAHVESQGKKPLGPEDHQ